MIALDSGAKPRRTVREIGTAVDSFARARWMLRHAQRGKRIRCYGRVLVEGGRGIVVSDRVVFFKGMLPTELRCEAGAELVIGPRTMLNYGVSIECHQSIRIGERCRFGSFVQLRDDDGRRVAPIVIGDDVWLAHGALIEPGVIIGDGSVIAAGAVVLGFVPPRTLAFGNPVQLFPLETDATPRALDADTSVITSYGIVDHVEMASTPPRPSPDEVRAAIIDWLDETHLFGEAASLVTSDEMSLREGGLLDSLGFVELVLMLEARYHVPIDRELASRPGCQSIAAIVELVTTLSRR